MASENEMEVICRTCLNETNSFKCIYKVGMLCGEITTLSSMLTECTSIEFDEDEDLPRFICMRCVQQLSKSYVFRQTVVKSNETLREQQLSIKAEDDMLDTLFYYEQSGHSEIMEQDEEIENAEEEEEEEEEVPQANDDMENDVVIDNEDCIKIELSSTETETGTEYEVTVSKDDNHMIIERNEEVGDEYSQSSSSRHQDTKALTQELINAQKRSQQRWTAINSALDFAVSKNCDQNMIERNEGVGDDFSQTSDGRDLEVTHDTTLEMIQENSKAKKRRSRKGQTIPGPPFKCEICGKILSNHSSYKYHMQLHSDATPFLCSHCGEKFKTRNAYDGHMTTHDSFNPNSCHICGKTYRQSSSLRIHMLTHTGEKPYLCGICGKGLTQKSGFKKHMLTHTGEKPFTCDICNKEFRYSSNLITHKRGHSGEKPYECKECDKRFTSGEQLRRHHLVHTGERPFSCETCGKSFNRRSTLLVHKQIHKAKTIKLEKQ